MEKIYKKKKKGEKRRERLQNREEGKKWKNIDLNNRETKRKLFLKYMSNKNFLSFLIIIIIIFSSVLGICVFVSLKYKKYIYRKDKN